MCAHVATSAQLSAASLRSSAGWRHHRHHHGTRRIVQPTPLPCPSNLNLVSCQHEGPGSWPLPGAVSPIPSQHHHQQHHDKKTTQPSFLTTSQRPDIHWGKWGTCQVLHVPKCDQRIPKNIFHGMVIANLAPLPSCPRSRELANTYCISIFVRLRSPAAYNEIG